MCFSVSQHQPPKRRAQLAARLAPKTSAGIKKRLKKMTRKKAMVKGLESL